MATARTLRATGARPTIIVAMLGLTYSAGCLGSTPEAPTSPTPPVGAGIVPPSEPNDAGLAVCPSAAQIASLALDVGFDPALRSGTLLCRMSDGSVDLTHRQLYVYVTLLTMRELRFSRALPWTDATLWDWFSALRPRLAVVASGIAMCSPCGRASPTLVIPVPQETPITWRNVARSVGGFAHEARHIEVGGHPCGTRDNRVDDLGAFGVHNLVYQWVANYSEGPVPDEARQAARVWACEQRNSAFCSDRCAGN